MNAFDVYFAFRLAFIDRPDVRLRTVAYRGRVTVIAEDRGLRLVAKFPVGGEVSPEFAAEIARDDWFDHEHPHRLDRLARARVR